MTTVWGDALNEDAWEDVWAEFVPFVETPFLMSSVSIYALLGGEASIVPAATATVNIYPVLSGRAAINEFTP